MKHQRNISAPFQPTKGGGGGECAHAPRSRGQTHHLNSAKTATAGTAAMTISGREENRVDYLSHKFHPLEADEHITFEKYCGPTPESNWVIPGKLLVGAYPASQDDTETFELLTSILRLGVNQFICLQLEYQSGVTETMWRSGQALRPYFEDVKLLVKNKHKFKILSEEGNVCESDHLNFVHFPIKDCSVTDDAGVFQLALELVESISKGHVQYLHCWGGHGRTGTLVCIMLHLMYGLTAEEAMRYCQKVHDLRQCPVAVGSPQTQTQRDQVTRIISIVHNQALASRPHSLPAANHHQPSSSTPNKTNSQQHNQQKKQNRHHQRNKIETKSTKISSEVSHNKEEEQQGQEEKEKENENEKEKQKEVEIIEVEKTTRDQKPVEVVDVNICLGNWLTTPSNPTLQIETDDPDIEVALDDVAVDPSTHSSCFYLSLIYSLNTNNRTPHPSPINKPATNSWFSRTKESSSTTSSREPSPATTPTWKDSFRGMMKKNNPNTVITTTSDTVSVSSTTPPLTPQDKSPHNQRIYFDSPPSSLSSTNSQFPFQSQDHDPDDVKATDDDDYIIA